MKLLITITLICLLSVQPAYAEVESDGGANVPSDSSQAVSTKMHIDTPLRVQVTNTNEVAAVITPTETASPTATPYIPVYQPTATPTATLTPTVQPTQIPTPAIELQREAEEGTVFTSLTRFLASSLDRLFGLFAR